MRKTLRIRYKMKSILTILIFILILILIFWRKIMEEKKKELRQKDEKAMLTFLKQTQEGKYAKIEQSSLPYSRLREQREEIYYEDEYYYSVR